MYLGQGVTSGMEDGTCAVIARLGVSVTQAAGVPLQDAEVWLVDEPGPAPPAPTRAERLGGTDASGVLTRWHCFAGSDEVLFWQREPRPTRLVLLILHDVYGVRRAIVEPPIADVFRDGDLRGNPTARYELPIAVTFR
jgi:hypothetical protein